MTMTIQIVVIIIIIVVVVVVISPIKTCTWYVKNVEDTVSYGTDAYVSPLRIQSAVVRIHLNAVPAICVQREREREREHLIKL